LDVYENKENNDKLLGNITDIFDSSILHERHFGRKTSEKVDMFSH